MTLHEHDAAHPDDKPPNIGPTITRKHLTSGVIPQQKSGRRASQTHQHGCQLSVPQLQRDMYERQTDEEGNHTSKPVVTID